MDKTVFGVSALIRNPKTGLILAISRKDDPNDLGLPGGKVEPGEKPGDAVIREVEEETGLKVLQLRQVFERPHSDTEVAQTWMITNWMNNFGKQPGEGEISWVPPKRLTEPSCKTFREYNTAMLTALGLI